jgi:outer membrane protein OmpA-like peptidoglycan-associated protein/tetratricopeptide (TPR) repeat protein
MKYLALIILACSFFQYATAQNVDFKSGNFKNDKEGFKKAEAAIELGDIYFKKGLDLAFSVKELGGNFQVAKQHFLIAQNFNPTNALLNYKIGVCDFYTTNPSNSFPFFLKAKELDPACDPFLNYFLGRMCQLESKFDEALTYYTKFNTEYKKAAEFTKFIEQHKKECENAKKMITQPLRVWVDNVNELNSDQDDIAPSISVDGGDMLFSSNRKNENPVDSIGKYDFEIYSSSLVNNSWSNPLRLSGAVNSKFDDVVNTISYDGTTMLMHRTENNQSDIYESKLVGANWATPEKMNANISHPKYNDRFACYNHTGYKIYFIRDNQEAENGFQIVYSGMESKLRKDYATTTFIDVLNSKFNEGPIYITIKGDVLYMSSQGHGSMGGYDIFVSKFVQGQWTAPVNMGYPINSVADDFFYSPTVNGKFAYITSNRAGGKGGYDIYKVTYWGPDKTPVVVTEDFLISSILEPVNDNSIESKVDATKKFLTVFKGNTIDIMNRQPVASVIEITDNAAGKIIETINSNTATGKFLITLPSGKNYGIAVKAPNYLFHSENFDLPDGGEDNIVSKTIPLKNVAVGSTITLANIFFDLGKSTLRLESNAELDRLVKFMNEAPNVKVEISGHTDNTGTASSNDILSQQRANAVVAYLISKGINPSRLIAKGYGSKKPITTNETESGRQQNRRTEFKITSNS